MALAPSASRPKRSASVASAATRSTVACTGPPPRRVTTRTCSPRSASSSAVAVPAGPAPTITWSDISSPSSVVGESHQDLGSTIGRSRPAGPAADHPTSSSPPSTMTTSPHPRCSGYTGYVQFGQVIVHANQAATPPPPGAPDPAAPGAAMPVSEPELLAISADGRRWRDPGACSGRPSAWSLASDRRASDRRRARHSRRGRCRSGRRSGWGPARCVTRTPPRLTVQVAGFVACQELAARWRRPRLGCGRPSPVRFREFVAWWAFAFTAT